MSGLFWLSYGSTTYNSVSRSAPKETLGDIYVNAPKMTSLTRAHIIAGFIVSLGVSLPISVVAQGASGTLQVSASVTGLKPNSASVSNIVKTVKVGAGVYEIVASPEDGTIYVAAVGPFGEKAAKIYALDAQTLDVKTTFDVSANPNYGLGINLRTQMLYGSDTRGGTLVVTDIKSGKVVASITDPADPKAHLRDIEVDEENNKIYVSNYGKVASVWVIDGNTNSLERIIENTGNGTMGLALDKSENKLYVTNLNADEVGVIDLNTYKFVDRIPTNGRGPINLVLDKNTRRLFVTNQRSGDVTVINLDSGKVTDTISTGEGALGINLNPNNNRVYVTNRRAGTLTIFDATTLEVLSTLETGTHPQTIAIDTKTNIVYVTNKAKSAGRGKPPIDDPNGDTVNRIDP